MGEGVSIPFPLWPDALGYIVLFLSVERSGEVGARPQKPARECVGLRRVLS